MMNKKDGLYIQLFSIHGLIRSDNIEMGRDADTGGQIRYVLELAEFLSKSDVVRQIDLFTRLINDKRVSPDYSIPVEKITDKANIIRIQCGGTKYIRKELLWSHLDEYTDKVVKYIKKNNQIPDIIHSHYADAGYVGIELSSIFGIPLIHTTHSLGKAKREKLLKDGMSTGETNKRYFINHRISIEEKILKYADLIIASTNHEIKSQYSKYNNKDMTKFVVIPPGVNLENFHPFYSENTSNIEEREARLHITNELNRFFLDTEKPLILSICRPDKRKNIPGLITAFGEDKELQQIANLAIFAGIRKDITKKEENEREVLTEMLLLLDRYDLYGKMAIPKKHDFIYEVPELFRIAAAKRGVFVNPALTEPFGLTLIEASASGLPIVATNDGGPNDIISNCNNGLLVDVSKPEEISKTIKKILLKPDLWKRYSNNGIAQVREYYSWESHCKKYLKHIDKLCNNLKKQSFSRLGTRTYGKRLTSLNKLIITDIDNTLIGGDNKELNHLLDILHKHKNHIGLGVATGRTVKSSVEVLKSNNIHNIDIIISSVGTEIYYENKLIPDKGWRTHLTSKWNREKIINILSPLDFLTLQEEETQREFKISYYMENDQDHLAKVHEILTNNRCRYNLVFSNNQFLDILPYRASKGKAIRYLSYKWEIPLENFLVCGDSGNDEEMLVGDTSGVIVGNYSKEIEKLQGRRKVYFSPYKYSAGIIDGIMYYNFCNYLSK